MEDLESLGNCARARNCWVNFANCVKSPVELQRTKWTGRSETQDEGSAVKKQGRGKAWQMYPVRVCIISFKQSEEAYENKAEDKGCCKHFSLSVKLDQLGQSEIELIEVWWTQKLFGANGSTWILRYACISSIYPTELVSNSYELRIFEACKLVIWDCLYKYAKSGPQTFAPLRLQTSCPGPPFLASLPPVSCPPPYLCCPQRRMHPPHISCWLLPAGPLKDKT